MNDGKKDWNDKDPAGYARGLPTHETQWEKVYGLPYPQLPGSETGEAAPYTTSELARGLQKLVDLQAERAQAYNTNTGKESYEVAGPVFHALFPDGLTLDTPTDQGRFHILNMIIAKMVRYCANFDRGGHVDSLDDVAVYAQILQVLDSRMRFNGPPDDNIHG